MLCRYTNANGKLRMQRITQLRHYENILIDMQRLPSLNWHKPDETKRSSRLGAPEGLITGGLEQRICLGKVAEAGEVFPSHWQRIGSLRKRPVKLILTKPPGERMKCLRNRVRHWRFPAITRGWADSPTAGVLTYRANVKSLLETSPLQRWDYPRTRTIA